jgi:glucose/arabinose dehydrogenase
MSKRLPALALVLAAFALLGAGGASVASAQTIPNTITIRNFFKSGSDSLTFTRPVALVPYPASVAPDSAYIVIQAGGKITTVRRVANAWVKTDSAVVKVWNGTASGNEQGLLGFAFHPNFKTNRKYYMYNVDSGSTQGGFDVLSERIADSTLRPHTTDPKRTLLRITDPYNNHNGGTIAFGADGYLYLGIGDGGSSGDPQARAQNTDSLLGKMLRFDVDGADAFPSDTTRNYAIPADNPFVGLTGYKPEIWAYGMRNPWKWSFDALTGKMWLGHVGQDKWESATLVAKGDNLGWKTVEGNHCYSPSSGCTMAGFHLPFFTYPHTGSGDTTGNCIIGGYVYRADPASPYYGLYFMGDNGNGRVWAVRTDGVTKQDYRLVGTVSSLTSFAEDTRHRLFALSQNGGVYILESPDMNPPASLRPARAPTGLIRLDEVMRNPGDYLLRDLGGRALRGVPSGIFFAIDRAHPDAAALLTGVR